MILSCFNNKSLRLQLSTIKLRLYYKIKWFMVETTKSQRGDNSLKQGRRKRGRPKKKRGPYRGDLKLLLAFLNWTVGSPTDNAELNAVVVEPAKARGLEDLTWLQKKLIEDLLLFTNPPRKGAYNLRKALCDKIRQFQFPLVPLLSVPIKQEKDGTLKEIGPWTVKPEFGAGAPVNAHGDLIVALTRCLNHYEKIKGDDLPDTALMTYCRDALCKAKAGVGPSDERYFYAMIADGLISRELDRLRRCQHCNRFFIADERRQIFCIPDHGRAYYDDPTLAKARVYKSRHKKEEGDITR
jgi:hypothetical protein